MKIHFYKQNNKWYVFLPDSPFSKEELEMIDGADTMCEMYANGDNSVNLNVEKTYHEGYDVYDKIRQDDFGATYNNEKGFTFWLCPVTKFIFDEYPEELYIKKPE